LKIVSGRGQNLAPPDATAITGTDDHDPTESTIMIHWIE